MSENKEPDIVDITPAPPKVEPPKEAPKPMKGKPTLPQRSAKEFAAMQAKPFDNSGSAKAFFDRFGGKAPHYKVATSFNVHDIDKADADNCRLFTSWTKPKRLGLTCEWAEKMRGMGKLIRLEDPSDNY